MDHFCMILVLSELCYTVACGSHFLRRTWCLFSSSEKKIVKLRADKFLIFILKKLFVRHFIVCQATVTHLLSIWTDKTSHGDAKSVQEKIPWECIFSEIISLIFLDPRMSQQSPCTGKQPAYLSITRQLIQQLTPTDANCPVGESHQHPNRHHSP